jgi:hypothetical protein
MTLCEQCSRLEFSEYRNRDARLRKLALEDDEIGGHDYWLDEFSDYKPQPRDYGNSIDTRSAALWAARKAALEQYSDRIDQTDEEWSREIDVPHGWLQQCNLQDGHEWLQDIAWPASLSEEEQDRSAYDIIKNAKSCDLYNLIARNLEKYHVDKNARLRIALREFCFCYKNSQKIRSAMRMSVHTLPEEDDDA